MNIYEYHSSPDKLIGYDKKHLLVDTDAFIYLLDHIKELSPDVLKAANVIGTNAYELHRFINLTDYPVPTTKLPDIDKITYNHFEATQYMRYANKCKKWLDTDDRDTRFDQYAKEAIIFQQKHGLTHEL